MRTATIYNYIIESTTIASIAIMLLTLVRHFLRKPLGNRALCFAWLLVAIRLLCPLALPNPIINTIRPTYSQDQGIRPIADQIKVRFRDASQYVDRRVSKARKDKGANDPVQKAFAAFVDSTYDGSLSLTLMKIYLLGAGVVLCYFTVSNIRFRRKLKTGRIEPITGKLLTQYQELCRLRKVKLIPVYFTDPLSSACLVGVFRPYIAMPLTAAPSEAISVLTHEVCHYKSKDHLYGILRLACCVIHWFNPLVWLAASMSRTDRELHCDDKVVEKLTQEDKLAYTNILVLAAAKRISPSMALLATGMTMTGKKLVNRVNAILQNSQTIKMLASSFSLLCCILLIGSFATAEYLIFPTLPAISNSYIAPENQSITDDSAAIAYAKAFWQTDLLGIDINEADWRFESRHGVFTVHTTVPALNYPLAISFLPDGTILRFAAGSNWNTSNSTTRLYDIKQDEQEKMSKYLLAFAKAMLPGVVGRIEGMRYNGEELHDEYRYVSFVGINSVSDTAYQFQVQVSPTVRIVEFYTDYNMQEQLKSEASKEAAMMCSLLAGGFNATNMAWNDILYTSPADNDIPLEDALALGLNAIYKHYGETADSMSRFHLEYGFRTEPDAFSESDYWYLKFIGTDPKKDQYQAMVHSPDGEILYLANAYGAEY